MNTFTAVLIGILLRLIVPIALTAIVVVLLHRLDVRWQVEAENELKLRVQSVAPCFKEGELYINDLNAVNAESVKPCWQARRLSNGKLREQCLDCEVFREAPMPVQQKTHGHVHA